MLYDIQARWMSEDHLGKTLEGNWYEQRFYRVDSRPEMSEVHVRSREDQVENIPRIARRSNRESPVFQMDDVPPEERFTTQYQRSCEQVACRERSTSETRPKMSQEVLRAVLDYEPTYQPMDTRLPEFSESERLKTTHRESFRRYF